MSTPIALWLAEKLEDPESSHGYRLVANNAADELRRLHQFELAFTKYLEKTEWVQETVKPHELGMDRADVLKQRIDRLHEVNQMLLEIAQSAESILSNCDVNSGVCCCGDSIESHPDAMYCGHTSVDSGWYAADSLLKKARAAIEKAGEA